VAEDPAYSEVKEQLAAQLIEQLEITGDPRIIGGADLFDQVPYLGQSPVHPSYIPE
jgi:hypothetical protein